MWDKGRGTEGGRRQRRDGGQWLQREPQQAVGVCKRDQWCLTPTCQAGYFSKVSY